MKPSIMKPRYRWFYSANLINQKRPTICVCLIEDANRDIGGIGISICSESDNPFSKRGRGQAFARAYRAFANDIPGEPIRRPEAIRVILNTSIPTPPTYKSVPSGNKHYDHLKDKFWPAREVKEESL